MVEWTPVKVVRPGVIVPGWIVRCHLCHEDVASRREYDEASIAFTAHLYERHPEVIA